MRKEDKVQDFTIINQVPHYPCEYIWSSELWRQQSWVQIPALSLLHLRLGDGRIMVHSS